MRAYEITPEIIWPCPGPENVQSRGPDWTKSGPEKKYSFPTFYRCKLHFHAEIHAFYDDLEHRNRRRKSALKAQKSEVRLFKRLHGMHDSKTDSRTLVLAYGAWGLVAGRPNMVANKGNPPAIGVGLMNKLAKHFVVAPTPEHYTSKTCVACGGICGPHPTLKTSFFSCSCSLSRSMSGRVGEGQGGREILR